MRYIAGRGTGRAILLALPFLAPGMARAGDLGSWPAAPAEVGFVSSDSIPGAGSAGEPTPRTWSMARVTATGVTEAAWASERPEALHLVVVGWEPDLPGGFAARLEVAGKWGHDGASFASAQGLSSLEAEDFGGVGEAWLEWRAGGVVDSGGPGLRLKAGRVDANTEFAYSDAAAAFGNPSFGLSPVLGVLPSYPSPAPSVNGFARPWSAGPELGGGLYRRADGSYAVVVQLSDEIGGPGRIRWSAGWAKAVGRTEAGRGAYLIVERASEGGVSPFLMVSGRRGGARHVATGAALRTLPLPVRASAGAGVSLLLGDAVADEAVAEMFVAVEPADWLRLQLHGQVHVAEGGAPSPGGLFRVVLER